MFVLRAITVKMLVMESITSESQDKRTEATTGPPLDCVRIVSTPGTCGGKPRIDGHRITVKHIVLDHQRGGMSPDEIVSAYPSLTLSDVYAALAFYHDHRADIDADIKADDDHFAEIEQQNRGMLIDRRRQRKANGPDNTLPPWMRTVLTRSTASSWGPLPPPARPIRGYIITAYTVAAGRTRLRSRAWARPAATTPP
jgi:uncharacterized protein (DUF433 family)